MRKLFDMGTIVATPGAIKALEGINSAAYLRKHGMGNWGDTSQDGCEANNQALKDGSRLLSVYNLPNGKTIWIITEATNEKGEREATTILLPEDY